MIAAIMQPTFLPWAGYFDLIDQADVFIFHDNVQFAKQSWQQRNRIRTEEGLIWVTLPARFSAAEGTLIVDTVIADLRPIEKARRQIANAYAKAAHVTEELPWIDAWLGGLRLGQSLADINIAFIETACARIGIATPVRRARAIPARIERTPRLVDLCRAVGADTYLSPLGSADYLRSEGRAFSDAGLRLEFQDYAHPAWRQAHAPFLPYASIVDLLLNEGAGRALEVIRAGRRANLAPQTAYARYEASIAKAG